MNGQSRLEMRKEQVLHLFFKFEIKFTSWKECEHHVSFLSFNSFSLNKILIRNNEFLQEKI